jgi:hypothetical protein
MIRQTLLLFNQSGNYLMDKSQFLSEIFETHKQYEETIERLDDEQLLIPGTCGKWSVKDVIAHITWYERQMVVILESCIFSGSDLWNLTNENRNEIIHAESHSLSLDIIRREAREVFKTMYDLLDTLSEDDLLKSEKFANMPRDWIPWEVIASNTCDHYPEHTRDILKAFPQITETDHP